ncbi:MAG TPA: two-component regulator propeller domain-containing protein [Bryobacteraceae bacterium]|nr:two-component regulator propeller domain-containing protein [Bryobacteraceae bacterium]
MAGLAAVCFARSASAIDPNRDLSQYIRDAWGAEKGFPDRSVVSIAQTSDGYLWIGTDKGLVRFDGLNFQPFSQLSPSSLAIGPVQTLLADGAGNLWILLQSTKLLRYRDGRLELIRGEAENGITAIARGFGDSILLSSLAMGTLAFNGERFERLVAQPAESAAASAETRAERSPNLGWSAGLMPHHVAAPASAVISMTATADGRIWLGAEDGGPFYLSGGHVTTPINGIPHARITCLLPVEKHEMWIGASKGVMRWDGNELTRTGVPPPLLRAEVLSMIRDRDANIWVGTTRGLLRFNANGVSSLNRNTTASSAAVTALLEDREGNIWVGGPRSLERLRDSAFVTYSIAGMQPQSMGALYVDRDDNTWFAPIDGGLRWLNKGRSEAVTAAGLTQDIVYSITGNGASDLWIGRQRGGLTNLRYANGAFSAKTYTQADGLAQNSVYSVYEGRDGTIWSGTLSNGVSKLKNGHFTNYTARNGLASNTVSSIAEDSSGTMWFGTPNGLSAMSAGGWRTYTVRDGLSSQDVNCLLRDSTGVLWIGTAEGLAFLSAGRIRVPQRAPGSLRDQVFGIAEDKGGWLWIATASHIVQVKRSSLMEDMLQESDFREYGLADGLWGTEGVKRYQSVVADSQGQVWFSTNRGISVVNPARATVNPVSALVHIDAVLSDGSSLDLRESIRVPAARQRTTFRYAGLSFGNPERVRYRYRLDNFDRGWSEPVTNREATYANLGAGSYRFRVMACNSDGLWNGSEAVVGFEVEPAFWQTWWFRLACVLCAGLAALLVYQLRMNHLTRLLNIRFEERLAERTRIAQDLHDNLLQGIVSASMQLHVAVDKLPDDSPARPSLNRVLQLVGQVVEEGRNTLRGLRSPIDSAYNLKDLFSRIPQELGSRQTTDFRVVVEGRSMPLRSNIRDDVYRIGREALVNAFRHSQASRIEALLEYAPGRLRILVRDNGCGIDPRVLQSGRAGHWGLSGMRERAEKIGAKLTVLSRVGDGTELELRVPGDIAFVSRPPGPAFRWFIGSGRHTEETRPESKQTAG